MSSRLNLTTLAVPERYCIPPEDEPELEEGESSLLAETRHPTMPPMIALQAVRQIHYGQHAALSRSSSAMKAVLSILTHIKTSTTPPMIHHFFLLLP